MRTAVDLAAQLRAVLTQEESGLLAITDKAGGERSGGGSGWVRKQELGHLLDSAVNNRSRFLGAAIQSNFRGPTYAQDQWVELGGYAGLSWSKLVAYWLATNELLAVAIALIPDTTLAAPCEIGDNATVTLEFLIVDYILHLQHHLDHILNRPEMTPYPGALVGV